MEMKAETDFRAEAEKHLEEVRREMRQLEQQDPLRRKILEAAAYGPVTLDAISEQLEAVGLPPEIQARLGRLVDEHLVYPTEDGFLLTRPGEIAFGRHRAFGEPEPIPPLPTREQMSAFLREALRDTVRLVEAGRISDAVERLELIRQQAVEIEDPDLAAEAHEALASLT